LTTRHEGHHPVDRTVEIYPHQPVPVRPARILDGLEQVDPGVVEQQRNRAEPGLDFVRCADHVLAARNIDLDPHDQLVVEALQRAVDMVLADIGDRDLAALGEQRPDQPDADTIGAAGDKGGAAGEFDHCAGSIPRTGLPGPA
jgi:hypothetical protein